MAAARRYNSTVGPRRPVQALVRWPMRTTRNLTEREVKMNPIDSFIVMINTMIGPMLHTGSSAISDLALTLGLF